MTVTARHLTSGDALNSTSFATASVTPVTGRLVVVTAVSQVVAGFTGPQPAVHITGCGLTFSPVSVPLASGDNRTHLWVYRALGTVTGPGSLTLNFGFDNPYYEQAYCSWSVTEYAGVVKTGANGANAILQTVHNVVSDTTSIGQYFATFADEDNAAVALVAGAPDARTITPGVYYTMLGQTNAAYRGSVGTEWIPSQATVAQASFSGTVTTAFLQGLELKASPVVVAAPARLTTGVTFRAPVIPHSATALPAVLNVSVSLPPPMARGQENVRRPITATHLTTDGSATDAVSYQTAVITPAADSLVLLAVFSRTKPYVPPEAPAVTGCGLTWVLIDRRVNDPSDRYHLRVYRAMGTPTTGRVTIDFGSLHSNYEQEYCWWSIAEFGHVNTEGIDGSFAIAQTMATDVESFAGEMEVPLGGFESADNATYGAFATSPHRTFTPGPTYVGPEYTIFGQDGQDFQGAIASEYKLAPDRGVNITFDGTAPVALGRALEIRQEPGSLDVNATATPARLSTGVTFSAPNFLAVGTATPDVLMIPLHFEQAYGGDLTGWAFPNPPRLSTTVTFPGTVINIAATPAPLTVTVTFPEPDILLIDATIIPEPLAVGFEFGEVIAGLQVIAYPGPLELSVSFAEYSGRSIRLFAAPRGDVIPNILPETKNPARALFRHYELEHAGHNVYLVDATLTPGAPGASGTAWDDPEALWDDPTVLWDSADGPGGPSGLSGTITEDQPFTTYDEAGQPLAEAWSRVRTVWWGGHQPTPVTDEEAELLVAAGYDLTYNAEVLVIL